MSESDYWILYRAVFKHTELTQSEVSSIMELYQRDGRNVVTEHIIKKKLLPATAVLMVKLGIDIEHWKPIADQYRERNMRIIVCLDEVYTALHKAGVTKIAVVENFGALLSSNEDLAKFGSGDVDQYADSSQRELIYSVFRQLGFSITERKVGSILISSRLHKEGYLPDGFYLGINWDVTCRVNLPCLSAKGELVDWDNLMPYRETEIRLPQREALLYICMLHVAVHGFSKAPDIRLYYDIANAASSNLDWEQIKAWATRDKHLIKISTGGYLAKQLLDVEIHKKILDMGNPVQKKRLLNLVYDQKKNTLKDFPSRITMLGIDVYSNDSGAMQGMRDVFFPPNDWVKRKYGSSVTGRFRHILDLI